MSRSPPRASPSAGSCVPAIGYPYMGPGALAGGPGSRARDRRFHGQFRSAANAGAAEKGISVSMMCDCEGKVAPRQGPIAAVNAGLKLTHLWSAPLTVDILQIGN